MKKPDFKCYCKNIDFGTYENTVSMKCPNIKRKGGWVSIDNCLATVMAFLWKNGIETLNSCCGHQKLETTVIVSEKSIKKMKELGYKNSTLDAPDNVKKQIFKITI